MPTVLLVLPTSTYRAADFLDAARELGADVVVASEEAQTMAAAMGDRAVQIDLCDPREAAATIARSARRPDAVVGVDEQGVEVAAMAAEELGLAHNPPDAVATTRDKAKLRTTLTRAGLAQPRVGEDAGFPCVVKATSLSGSRGVIRADDPSSLDAALVRVRGIAGEATPGRSGGASGGVLVESYVPGAEVAVEGLLVGGELHVLAIFDKPDPLEGPYFEETIYVTPSRSDDATQQTIARTVADACAAIGLIEGPIHAELRLPDAGGPGVSPGENGPVLLEVAARSIGGLCSRTLRFGAGISLEEVILRHALGLPLGDLERERLASGVMMIPIPRAGTLREVSGVDEARAVDGIVGLEVTVPRGQPVQTLPEGDRYLGFIFATGATPARVEGSLRAAHAALDIHID
jgi:biotin carboxylase